ncbi:9497_t:CDS:2, partial [Gigaspora margarita]
SFFNSVRSHGLNPTYFYTDKDFAKINAAKEAWPNTDIQLCQWHIDYDAEERYVIDLNCWICSCPSLLHSRFLICKYLIHCAIEKAKLDNPEGIRLVYKNFKRRTNYPFLIWDGSEPNETFFIPNLDLQQLSSMAQSGMIQSNMAQSSMTQSDIVQFSIVISVDDNGDRVDPNLYQQCETKVVELEYLVNHLREELSNKNLRHNENLKTFSYLNFEKDSNSNNSQKLTIRSATKLPQIKDLTLSVLDSSYN